MINLLLCGGTFGPLFILYSCPLNVGLATFSSMLGILGLAAMSSFLWLRLARDRNLFGASVGRFEGAAIDQLAEAELGSIYMFPSKHAWCLERADWLSATHKFGFTLKAVFVASRKFSYLKIGFLCLPTQYLGFAADFGPGSRFLLAAATANLFFAQVFVILISSWAASLFLYLGFNRAFAHFNGSLIK